MKAIADTLEVSRSNLIERLATKRPKRGPYTKSNDADLMPLIREIVLSWNYGSWELQPPVFLACP